jgi:Ni,Fe-hydrogenase III large subunit
MALIPKASPSDGLMVLSLPCPDRCFPSVASKHRPADRLERAIVEMHGLAAAGAPDGRPWLDHNRWGVCAPLGSAATIEPSGQDYAFHKAEGAPIHQIPVGPVHAGIIEPGHFRFHCNGETVVRLEERLGYVHKGIEALLRGAPLAQAVKISCRVSGDSAVAYGWAFAAAVEAAASIAPPPRALAIRAVMAELERVANHLGDIGAICNDASFSLMLAHCGALRERVLRAANACFGHRLMMDRVVPGGVTNDLDAEGMTRLTALVADIRQHFPELVELYENTASLQDRTVTTGILRQDLARLWAPGGYVGRAAGLSFDARRTIGYAPYPFLDFEVPQRQAGDVDARVWIRIEEVTQSLRIIEQLIARLPDGSLMADTAASVSSAGKEGVALIEAFRGDLLAWVRLGPNGTVAAVHLRDASWFQWPLLEAVIEGNIVADFPLCNKSFNCSYAGHDL